MDTGIKADFDNLSSKDKNVQYEAFTNILTATQQKVDWAYDVWDQLIEALTHPNHHTRSRAAQFLANLAISDAEERMLNDFPDLWKVTYDSKFVTARHTLQSIWRVGLAGPKQQKMVMSYFEDRYIKCTEEKNYTLIRFDLLQSLKRLYDEVKDEAIKQKALELIELEEDEKYRKKYAKVWKES